MKKILLTLLFGMLGLTTTFASFPVLENESTNEISLSVEDPDISKSAKILWFAIGLLGTAFGGIIGLAIAAIYQLITKKKGPITYALYGFLSAIILLIIFIIILLGEFEDFNPFIFS